MSTGPSRQVVERAFAGHLDCFLGVVKHIPD